MTKPDSSYYNPDPTYLRGILKARGYTQAQAALAIGIAPRTIRRYLCLNPKTHRDAPYPVVYAIENLPSRRRARRSG